MKISFWTSCVFAVLAPAAFANGGGYFRGGVERAGDVAGFEPQETEKIRILDEKLTVALGAKAADVEVRYLMRNETDKKVKVRFGFPVEESFDQELMTPVGEDGSKKTKLLRYCQNYVITASGKSIEAKWQAEEKTGNDKRFKGIAGWLVSEISFASGEEKPVMIHFHSGYPFEEWNVSEETSVSATLFRYRLSTAACWAGTIGMGKITLKPAGIDPRELKVLKPVNRFKKDGDNWVWNFENLEPVLADDFEVEVMPEVHGHTAPDKARYIERGGQWFISHANYEVQASSTLPTDDRHSYEAGNLKHHGRSDAWTEGAKGSGVGEWLELKPVSPKPLAAIEILPGFARNEALFQANARPKKIMITLNGEHRFSADVPDAMDDFHRIPIQGYTKSVKTIRLTFEEVWPGTKFEDLCVSSIRLQVRLDKKPKLEPVR